ncbi:hypothetical protein BH24ACT5_BH24ACT5_26230 [soil metagenome]
MILGLSVAAIASAGSAALAAAPPSSPPPDTADPDAVTGPDDPACQDWVVLFTQAGDWTPPASTQLTADFAAAIASSPTAEADFLWRDCELGDQYIWVPTGGPWPAAVPPPTTTTA